MSGSETDVAVRLVVGVRKHEAGDTWYEFAGTGSLAKFFSGIPAPKAVASLSIPSWNQILAWLRQMDSLRKASGHAA